MPSKKHTKKNKVVARGDANENVRKSIAEKERVAAALVKRRERMMEEYEAEMKRRKEEAEKAKEAEETKTEEPVGDVANQ